MKEINDFVAWVRANYKWQKLGYRHKGDFYNDSRPVTLEALAKIYEQTVLNK